MNRINLFYFQWALLLFSIITLLLCANPSINENESNPLPTASTTTTTVSIKDTILLSGTATDQYGKIVKWEWDAGNTGTFVETTPDSCLITTAPSIANSMYQCLLRVTDDDNNSAMDTVNIIVLLDLPVPTASTSTSIISVKDTFHLIGTASDQYGTIVKWEWDVGNTGTFVETTPDSSYTTVALSIANNAYQCVLKVTDNDGNIAIDTVTINVLLNAPIPTASTTTPTVSINDSIRLQGTATDVYGTIVKWEWDAGNTGTFVETTPDSSYTTVALSIANNAYQCVLKVTDNDGNIALDTVTINVLTDTPIATASTTTPTISINDTIRLEGTATDVYGTIVKWEWKFGSSAWVETSSGDTTITAPATAQFYICSLRVTDDDGLSATNSVVILVGSPTITDVDGNVYGVIKIGNQVWTVENLRTTKYNDGTVIPNKTDYFSWADDRAGAYCYFMNQTANAEKYGALYNWHAVNTGKLAPAGWHVPTDGEWTQLEEYLIANGYNWDGSTSGNKIAKSMAATTDWNTSSNAGAIGNDLNSNNRTYFSALPGGYRTPIGSVIFNYMGHIGYWWSATEDGASYASRRSLSYYEEFLSSYYVIKECGFSVRLVRD